MSSLALSASPPSLSRIHDRRLREIYRSSGWPSQDPVEVELLIAGLIERVQVPSKPDYLRLTQSGLERIAASRQQNRSAMDAHEALVERVALSQIRQGRIAFQGLTLRAKVDDHWMQLRPDVFSIRNTSREDYLEPVIHEIKVSRADLRTDLKKPAKRAGYIALSAECYYVLASGVGTAADVPPECGVLLETPTGLITERVSPKRAAKLSFESWMALAKSTRCQLLDDGEPQL